MFSRFTKFFEKFLCWLVRNTTSKSITYGVMLFENGDDLFSFFDPLSGVNNKIQNFLICIDRTITPIKRLKRCIVFSSADLISFFHFFNNDFPNWFRIIFLRKRFF